MKAVQNNRFLIDLSVWKRDGRQCGTRQVKFLKKLDCDTEVCKGVRPQMAVEGKKGSASSIREKMLKREEKVQLMTPVL